MAATHQFISSSTVGSGGSTSVVFSSIPQIYTDLKVVWSAQNNRADGNFGYLMVAFNSSSSSFSLKTMYSTGSSGSQGSSTETSNYASFALGTQWQGANTFGSGQMYIPNYSSGAYKSFYVDEVNEKDTSEVVNNFFAGLWSNTNPITSITFTTTGNATKFNQYSNFYLYGIKNS